MSSTISTTGKSNNPGSSQVRDITTSARGNAFIRSDGSGIAQSESAEAPPGPWDGTGAEDRR
ncbi:hypothetical protein Misp02_57470 [Microtetraspora sp. NBRC 16547]|nr:hypothetical protein Misp02_57470 [Microtetraspora sp. NBRC 16547]